MKRYIFALLLVVMLALQACGPVEQAPSPSVDVPAIQANEPSDTSLQGAAVNSKPSGGGSGGCAASASNAASFQTQVVSLVNTERANRGLGALTAESRLTQAAQTHAQDMGCNFFMSHTGSDGSDPYARMLAAGYTPNWWGENVAAGYATPSEVMTAWMNSQTHRDNILNPNFTQIGIGYVYNAQDTVQYYYHYWSMSLASPGQ